MNGLTKINSELVCFHGLLEKKYSNNHDASYTYVDSVTSDPILLTLLMMKEWARAMVTCSTNAKQLEIDRSLQYNGSASVSQPPSTPMFDPVNRKPSLYTYHSKSGSTFVTSNIHGVSSDLAHILQIISNVASIARIPSKPPTTPTRPRTSSSASIIYLPTRNTPSKLSRFLEYAETNLGVENTHSHEEGLRILGFGPDILHLIDNKVLKDVGFTPRDIIRLKQNLQQWWNSADTKRKWPSQSSPGSSHSTPPNKRVTFEKRYQDGGCYRLYGPKMVESNRSPDADIDWYYFCKARSTMVPLLFGYVPVLNGEVVDGK